MTAVTTAAVWLLLNAGIVFLLSRTFQPASTATHRRRELRSANRRTKILETT